MYMINESLSLDADAIRWAQIVGCVWVFVLINLILFFKWICDRGSLTRQEIDVYSAILVITFLCLAFTIFAPYKALKATFVPGLYLHDQAQKR